MKDIRLSVEEYIDLRRGVGFDLRCQAGILRDFARFAEREDAALSRLISCCDGRKQPAQHYHRRSPGEYR